MATALLTRGNGHQVRNRAKAMAFAVRRLGAREVDAGSVDLAPFGLCHFAAYASPDGAMVSTPGRHDHAFGDADWHARGRVLMVRDLGDGRVAAYVCSIRELLDHRTIGHHGVAWTDVARLSLMTVIWRLGDDGEPIETKVVKGPPA